MRARKGVRIAGCGEERWVYKKRYEQAMARRMGMNMCWEGGREDIMEGYT